MSRLQRTLCFTAVFAVVSAHTLRNVSLMGYLAAYGVVLMWSFVAMLRSGWRSRLEDRGVGLVVWLGIALCTAVVTVAASGASAAANGLSRFLFALPVAFALVAWTDDRRDLLRHLGVMVAGFALLSLTLPMQFVTGPVSFFAAPSTRGGDVRYASAVGSLTSIGIIVGCYLVMTQLLRPRWRWPLLVLISLPAVVSLSKAAIANVAVAWVIVLWLNRRQRLVFWSAFVGFPALGLAAYSLVPAVKSRVDTNLLSFGLTTDKAVVRDDVSLVYSIMERLTMLPAENWVGLGKLQNPVVYLVGGGYGMGDTALVAKGQGIAMMAHNQVFESLSVFGIVGGLLQWSAVTVLVLLLLRRHRGTRDVLYSTTAIALVVFVVNSWLANGTLYQPLAGAMFYLMAFIALSTRVRNDAQPPARDTGATRRHQWN